MEWPVRLPIPALTIWELCKNDQIDAGARNQAMRAAVEILEYANTYHFGHVGHHQHLRLRHVA
jgi:hypothetical protein